MLQITTINNLRKNDFQFPNIVFKINEPIIFYAHISLINDIEVEKIIQYKTQSLSDHIKYENWKANEVLNNLELPLEDEELQFLELVKQAEQDYLQSETSLASKDKSRL